MEEPLEGEQRWQQRGDLGGVSALPCHVQIFTAILLHPPTMQRVSGAALGAWCPCVCMCVLTAAPQGRCFLYLHITKEDPKAQRGGEAGPESHSLEVASWKKVCLEGGKQRVPSWPHLLHR